MADWKGRGGGRPGSQPSLSFSGGAGKGGGRGGGQPSLTITGGIGKGGGRSGSQPSLTITGGIGKGGGRSSNQPSLSISGGPGKGGGRAGSQPTISAAVNYGGSTAKKAGIGSSTTNQRAGSAIKAASGEKNPRVADPEGNFIFTLEIDGVEVAQFKECSGIKSSTQIFELEEGGLNHVVHKLPGQSRWENITLRAGVTSSMDLMKWRDEILQDEFVKRRNGSIVLMTLAREEVRRYNFVHAWPVTWEGPAMDANSADLAIESLEIAHHGVYVT